MKVLETIAGCALLSAFVLGMELAALVEIGGWPW